MQGTAKSNAFLLYPMGSSKATRNGRRSLCESGLVWVGHSCPTPLTLVLHLWDGHSCPTKTGNLNNPDVHLSQTQQIQFSYNSNSKASDRNVQATQSMPSQRTPLDRMYEYRRMLPHYQKPGRALFVTFCKLSREQFSADARDTVMQCCLRGHGNLFQLHAAVIMPDHVHLLLPPLCDEKGWPYGLPAILKLIKGASARSVNKLLGTTGPVWQEESFDHVLRSQESLEEKLEYIRQNPVRRGLVQRPEDYPWLWVEPR